MLGKLRLKYEVKVMGLWLLSATLITLGCIAWNNTTLPLALTGAVCVFASEGVINRYER